jgi:hypothetical protein
VNVGDGGLIVFGGEHRGGFAPFYLWRGSAVLAKLKSSTAAAPAQKCQREEYNEPAHQANRDHRGFALPCHWLAPAWSR